jgi:hypothetical protein
LTDILTQIQTMTRLIDRSTIDAEEQAYFSSAVFMTQNRLTTFYGAGIFNTNDLPSQDQHPTIIRSYEMATSISLCIYTNIVLRKLPFNAPFHYIMAQNLKDSLEETAIGSDLIIRWKARLGLLYWILFIGAMATSGRPERTYFMVKLAHVGRTMLLATLSDFVDVLRETVWSDAFYSPQNFEILAEASRLLSAPSTPSSNTTFSATELTGIISQLEYGIH